MTNLIRLWVPAGGEDGWISHGTQHFVPRIDAVTGRYYVEVPPEASIQFTHNGGFEVVKDVQTPAPAGMALLAHPEGPAWPDGSARVINGIEPRPDGLYEVPVHMVPALGSHGLDAPERVFAGIKTKLEEKLGLVDAAAVESDVAGAVKQAVAKAEAERDAAVERAKLAEDELAETKKELDELRGQADASAAKNAKIKSQAKEIAALNVEVEKSEQEITELLNEEQVEEATKTEKTSKKK